MINKHPFAVAMLVHLLKDLFDVQTPQDLEEFERLEELSLGVESEEPVNNPSFFSMQSDDEDDDVEDNAQDDNTPGIAVEVAQTRGKGFDFKRFIESLDNNDDKHEIIEKYKKHVGIDLRRVERIEDLPLYKDYLAHFDTKGIKLFAPEYLDDGFDLDLLLRVVVGSFSSGWAFEFVDGSDAARLLIKVSAGDRHIDKYLDALWGFQIARRYEIYIEEQLELEVLMFEDENGKEEEIIESQRHRQLEKYDEQLARYRKHTMLLALQGDES